MPQAISYTRFSAIHQKKGSSLERQQENIDKWLAQHPDVKLSRFSRNDTGKSGYTGAHLNHGLGQILEAISGNHIRAGDYILVEAIDRIGRLQMWDMFDILKQIISAGVIIVTLEDNREYSIEDFNQNPSSIYFLIGKIQQAHEYSKILSSRVLTGYEKKRIKARSGGKISKHTPFWLTKEGTLIPENAEIVKACVDLYLSGRGPRKVIQELMNEYPILKEKHPSTLKRWFKNRALIGEWQTKGEIIPNVFEPLIDSSTFYQLQIRLKERSKKMSPEQTYHLSGLVVCDKCNSRFYFRRKKHNGNTIIYSNCSTYLKRGIEFCDNNTTWPYEVFKYVLHWGIPIALSANVYNQNINNLSQKIDELKIQKQEKEDQIRKLTNALMELEGERIIIDKLKLIKKEKDDIESQISQIEETLIGEAPSHPAISDQIMESTNSQIDDIIKDPILYRERLKKTSFRLNVYKKKLKVNSLPPDNPTIELLRRSTRHNCYILKITTPAYEIFDEDSDQLEWVKPESMYAAVDRKGERATGYTEEHLIHKLINNDDHESYFKHPNE
ncbi:recombinase family protein [Marinobacter sp.]|uniref:recombinase family protein n=1 Tax=Marinobacter sp. TaxID=50741 RepID=UPI0035C6D28F